MDLLKDAIRMAFVRGEDWGFISYHKGLIPAKEDTEQQIQEATRDIIKKLFS